MKDIQVRMLKQEAPCRGPSDVGKNGYEYHHPAMPITVYVRKNVESRRVLGDSLSTAAMSCLLL